MDVGPIVSVFNALLTAGAAVSRAATAFFVMLAGFTTCPRAAVSAVESAKGSPTTPTGFATVIPAESSPACGGALGALGNGRGGTGGGRVVVADRQLEGAQPCPRL
jgi:hypothetical protein